MWGDRITELLFTDIDMQKADVILSHRYVFYDPYRTIKDKSGGTRMFAVFQLIKS